MEYIVHRCIRTCLGGRWSAIAAVGLLLAGTGLAAAQTQRGSGLALPRYVSLGSDEVNVRYGPGKQYPVRWLFKRDGLPVRIVAEYDTWRKIEDYEGEEGWIHSSLLSSRRTIVIQNDVADLLRTPSDDARVMLHAEPGVLGQLYDCQEDWCLVEIAGRRGWLRRTAFWGVSNDEFRQ